MKVQIFHLFGNALKSWLFFRLTLILFLLVLLAGLRVAIRLGLYGRQPLVEVTYDEAPKLTMFVSC